MVSFQKLHNKHKRVSSSSAEREREISPTLLIHPSTNQPTLYITELILILLLLLLLEESHRLVVQVDFGVDVGVDGRVPVVAAARVTVGVDAVYTVAAISIVVVVVVAATTIVVVVVVVTSSSVVVATAVVVVSVVVGDTRTAATAAATAIVSAVSIISSSSSIVAIATWKTFRVEAVYATGASSSSATTTTLIISRVLALAVGSESFKRLVEFSFGIAVFPCAERAFFMDRVESVYDGRLGVFAAIAVDFVVDAFGVRAQVDARGRLGRSGLQGRQCSWASFGNEAGALWLSCDGGVCRVW